jgi:hypothetical protein
MRNEPRRRRYNGLSVENIRAEDASRPISGGLLPVTKIKKRRRPNYNIDNKCVNIIAVLCLAHAIRHFLLFTPYGDDYLQFIRYPMEFAAPMLRSSSRELHQLDYAKRNRRRRTTPLRILEGSKFSFSSPISVLDYSKNTASDVTYPSFPTTDYVAGDDICGHSKKNAYNTSDRIIISGIFSHPVAAEMALTLAERCGVRHIVGLSDHLLNTEESSRLEFLFRRIPGLELKVGKGPLGDRATQELFESFLPSHVFYFQSESFKISTISDDDDEESVFVTHSGTDQIEQICNTIVKIQSKSEEIEAATSLLYMASSLPQTNDSDKNDMSVTIISKSNQILLDTYRIQYQLDVKVLNLPIIFGPFKEGALWLLSDEFIPIANENQYNDNASSNLTTTTSFNMTQPIISITDAIRSILVAGKWGHVPDCESIPILAAAKSQTTTLLNLSKTLLPLLTTSSIPNTKKKALDTSLLPIISWNYKTAMPYRDPAEFDTSPIENDKIATLGLNNTRHHLIEDENVENAGFSQLERRQHNIFPCVSVCSSFVKCRSSIWDPILSIAKSATEGCQFLLYAADFSPTLDELPVIRESSNNAQWPRDSFCQLAFVSSNSTIVKNAIQKEIERNGDEASKDKTVERWNGQVSSNGWTLVWVDKDEESISEADFMIPKINPESILNPSVQFVFYIEPHHYESLPPLQIMWFLMGKQLSAAAQRKNDKSYTNKEWLIPGRQIAFFTHTYNESDIEHLDPTKPDYISKAAKFILEQNGKSNLAQEDASQKFNTTRQSEAYTSSLIWQKEEGFKFELVDTPLMIYSVHNIRGRQFRCEWYEEQLFWSNEDNRNLEGLSLSYVLHRWRRRGRLLRNTFDDKWGEMMLLRDNGEELSPSTVQFKKLADKEEGRKEVLPPSDTQHYVKIHNPLAVRKFYSYE